MIGWLSSDLTGFGGTYPLGSPPACYQWCRRFERPALQAGSYMPANAFGHAGQSVDLYSTSRGDVDEVALVEPAHGPCGGCHRPGHEGLDAGVVAGLDLQSREAAADGAAFNCLLPMVSRAASATFLGWERPWPTPVAEQRFALVPIGSLAADFCLQVHRIGARLRTAQPGCNLRCQSRQRSARRSALTLTTGIFADLLRYCVLPATALHFSTSAATCRKHLHIVGAAGMRCLQDISPSSV